MTKILSIVAVVFTAFVAGMWGLKGFQNFQTNKVQEALAEAAKIADEQRAFEINDSTVAQPVNSYRAARRAFNAHTGKAQVWVNRRPDDILECFGSAGYNQLTGKSLEEIKPQDVEDIFRDPRYRPAPPPRSTTPALPATYLPVQCPNCSWQPEVAPTEPPR
jgi:hypothetical protein